MSSYDEQRRRTLRRGWTLVAILVLGLGAVGCWWALSQRSQPQSTQVQQPTCSPPDGCASTEPSLGDPTSSADGSSNPSSGTSSSGGSGSLSPATASASRPPGVQFRPVDGRGPSYFSRFAASFPMANSFFPIGMWAAVVGGAEEVQKDKSTGINTYVALWPSSNPQFVKGSGLYVLATGDTAAKFKNIITGWISSDEADMWAGPGDAQWTGNEAGKGPVCTPEGSQCGYTVQKKRTEQLPKDKRVRWSNYGKGVVFWQSDAQAGRFVNDYQDVVSADVYWYTDGNVCGAYEGGRFISRSKPREMTQTECRRAANYGATVRRLRSLVKPAGSKPVWAFVELGHPSSGNGRTITVPQIKAATWSSLINGARGITYFNHSFGGSCVTHNILRDKCYTQVRAAVIALNTTITRLAPVLNSPDVTGLVTTQGKADVLVKAHGNDLYLFAGSTGTSSQRVTFTLKCAPTNPVTVIDENRTVQLSGRSFTDTFASETAVHLYQIPNGATQCGLRN